jgi:hypothetical protein
MQLDKLIAQLTTERGTMGKDPTVYLLIDNNELYEVDVRPVPKGKLGDGYVLFVKGKKLP